jgi:hypothetical protein
MRYFLLVVLLWLGLLFCVGMHTGPTDDARRVDPRRPATLVTVMARGAGTLLAQVRGVGQGVKDAFGAPQRDRVERHLPIGGVGQ